MNMEFFAQMAWKSALISAGALAILALLRARPAEEKAALIRTAFALILALPLLALLLPALPVVTALLPAPEAAPLAALPPAELASLPLAAGDGAAAIPAAAAAAEPAVRDDPTLLILLAWLGGVAMVALRLVAGLWTLRRWTATASEVECPHWRSAFEALGGSAPAARDVRLLVADVPSPLGWGWLRPVILIDRDTIRDPDEAEAVLAHELAHVERQDWLVLILARIVVALFWFNPLIWLLERQLIEEGEQAADARALARVEPARYAQTLLSCARNYPGLPATGIADTGLARRVKAVLEGRVGAPAGNARRIRIAVLACIAFAAPIAALKPIAATAEPPAAPPAPADPAAPSHGAFAPPPAPAAPAAPLSPLAAALAPLAAMTAPTPPTVAAPAAPPPPAWAMLHVPPAPPAPPARHRDDDDDYDDDHDYDVDLDPEDRAEMAREIRESLAEAQAEIAEAAREAAEASAEARAEALEAVRASSHARADAARAVREAARISAEAVRTSAHARAEAVRATQHAARISADARAAARRGMIAGAAGMAEGARGMERGAQGMEAEAERLRSPGYRAEQIAKAERRGEHVTDRQLIELIPKLREGARDLRRGAVELRRDAERMRSEHN